ncbi:S-layer homology domain-containing protein [Patescibacteria group bacterium]|nr:S-layer homology domain-containing protein [Patescibacteria group bacterium]
MKKLMISIIILSILALPSGVLALSTPTVSAPSKMDADFYTFTISVPIGSTVSVLGGPSFLPPVTDGAGSDELDGEVEVMVGLAQEQVNVFSITAEREGEFSDSVEVTIHETSGASGGQNPQGDITAPDAPVLQDIENPITAYQYTIKGSCEADANIYVRDTEGNVVGSTQANSNGIFQVTVDLEVGKTNRLNVSAEDAAGNEGSAAQAVIQAVQPDYPEEQESPAVSDCPFKDVDGHWAEDYICTMYEEEIVRGRTETTFDPNANITRAELTKIALNTFGHSVYSAVSEPPFADVPVSAWYAPYVQTAKEMAIVGGFPDGTFGPDKPITRAATMKILVVASELDDVGYVADFPDVQDDDWFSKYVGFAQVNEIVGGYADGKFHPDSLITRAEVAKIAMKLLELTE